MPATPFDHPLLSGLLGDDEIGPQFSAEAEVEEYAYFEEALARAEAAEGIISEAAAEAISLACGGFSPDFDEIREAAAKDGVVAVEYVRQLRSIIPAPHAEHLHFGATSQDLVDTSLVLRLRPVLPVFDGRLAAIIAGFDDLVSRFGARHLMGRTRMRDAVQITVADRLGAWREPLQRHRARLAEIEPRLVVLQFGGAAGTRDKLGGRGELVARRLADALSLGYAPSWQTQRDNVAEFAGWLALVSGSLGKIGADISLMAQDKIGEIELAGGGGSSAMPHKSNPVRAEVLAALARHNAALSASMHQSLVHEQERSGAAWTLEWLTLPQMVMTTAVGLRTTRELLAQIATIGKLD